MLKSHTAPRRFRALDCNGAPFFQCPLDLARCYQAGCARLLASWWGIQIGQSCSFYGVPVFRRLPGSTIRIRNNCEFRSGKWSNLVGINRPCIVSTLRETAQVRIGNDCGFSGTIISSASRISIGDRVMCGANVTITDTDWHPAEWRDRIAKRQANVSPIVTGDDVWLGMNVTVLKGVEIGSKTVVGAGSTVTKSLPEGVVAAGHPAVVVRKLALHQISPQEFRALSLVDDEIRQ